MSTHPGRPIGFRRTEHWQDNPRDVGWRFWIGPLLVARTPGVRPGISVGWTRNASGPGRDDRGLDTSGYLSKPSYHRDEPGVDCRCGCDPWPSGLCGERPPREATS